MMKNPNQIMKPIITKIRSSKFNDARGNPQVKKFVPAKKQSLPEVDTQVAIVAIQFLEGYELFDQLFLNAIATKNIPVIQFLKANLTQEQIALLNQLHTVLQDDN